ncbi:MAG: Flp pilus assembly complex ATPase component TadA [Candidatus Marsarchaeota archaeon]|nr:Flp pilus assembly complex ATPase component TadA [Candidatus Marsarchaeota archaeon]
MNNRMQSLEDMVLNHLFGKFVGVSEENSKEEIVFAAARKLSPTITLEEVREMYKDITDLSPISDFLDESNTIEDIMVNNTGGIYVYDSKKGYVKVDGNFKSIEDLNRFVSKLKLYATNTSANGNILDVHMPSGSRANVISSPLGYDVTIRNFKSKPISILDLINYGTLDYKIAARFWLYTDGLKVRPANLLIGGIPAAGKTTLLNAMFSFFRPDQRVVTIEETYELNTEMHSNTVKLETSPDMPMVELVKNALRMRPDLIIIGEVRGSEANDMLAAMNVGKISMGTIHASSSRDIITRLEHFPMGVPRDILPIIDALVVVSAVYINGMPQRKVIQISEISGIETQVLLSDIYKFDYRTHQSAPILPSVQYRDLLSRILGVSPTDILAEEAVRAKILEQINRSAKRDMSAVSEAVQEYYDNPEALLKKVGLPQLSPVVKV